MKMAILRLSCALIVSIEDEKSKHHDIGFFNAK
jgi:hypothetical protein